MTREEDRSPDAGLAAFDRVGGALLCFVFVVSAGIALAQWDWFPTGEGGDIARVPPTPLNYAALLLPWVSLLVFLLVRRHWFARGS